MNKVSEAQRILTRATNELLTVGRERNYQSDTFWNAIYAITIAQQYLIDVEYAQ